MMKFFKNTVIISGRLSSRYLLFLFLMLVGMGNAAAQDTFYWFGGSGNWSDINKWSLTSGNSGNALAPRVPTINDNVIFDDNSFPNPASRYVTISAASFVRDLRVQTSATGTAPSFLGAGTLTVSGDFLLQPHVTWNRTSSSAALYFTPAGDQTLDAAGLELNEAVSISGPGSISLANQLYLGNSRNLTFSNYGKLTTNDHPIYVQNLSTSSATGVQLNLGASAVSAVSFNSGPATINAGTSHITIRQGSSSAFRTTGSVTFYDVTFLGTSATFNAFNSNFHNVTFVNQGAFSFEGNHTIENLTLAPGSINTFNSGTTQTITGTFTAVTPDCSGLLEMKRSTSTGSASTINVSSGGVVDIPNARITGMTATGGATFNVVGVDNGGNTGWNFTQPPPKTIYWVGGAVETMGFHTGYFWNNADNWSDQSGGAGGYCIPTQFDNVVFDDNSDTFHKIYLYTNEIGYCHDITVEGWKNENLEIQGVGNNSWLEIYGASTWKNGMTVNTQIRYKSSDAGEILTFDGVQHGSTTYFWGAGGWIFADDFSSTGAIYLTQGTLNTNDKEVYIGGNFYSANTSSPVSAPNNLSKTLLLGASEVSVNYWSIATNTTAASFTLDAGTSHIIVRNGSTNQGFQPLAGQTYYDVTLQGANTLFNGNNITFNDVIIEQNAIFSNGTKTYQNLTLGNAKVYNFAAGSNQIILGSLNSNTPDCSGMTEFRGPVTGTATITKASGTIHIPNVLMENMTATGGATFTANGLDLDGNTGWTFTPAVAKDLYWIGGTGNWNDAANWTENSDGTPSGGCIPTQFDNVFFNQYSGADGITVTIAGTPAYCHDMTWLSGAPANATLIAENLTTSSTDKLTIYGSYTMGQNMIHRIYTYFQSSDMGETITFNGSRFMTFPATFDGSGGWTFQDEAYFHSTVSTSDYLTFKQGTLDFGGHNAILWGFSSTGNGQRHLNIEGSEITVDYSKWNYYGTNLTLQADNSHINIAGVQNRGEFLTAPGLQWHNITMSATTPNTFVAFGQVSNNPSTAGATYNHVKFLRDVYVYGSHTFNTFEVAQTQRTISFGVGTTQTILENTYLSGTPCQPNTLNVLNNGTANLNVMAGNIEFDYVSVSRLNASGGEHLTFQRNSTNGGNNVNITFVTGSGGLIGLGEDWLCHEFDSADPSTYTLDASGFFGGPDSQYSWTKVGDPNHTGVLGTGLTLDISSLGYGTYRVDVDYGGGSTCKVNDVIVVRKVTDMPVVSGTYTQDVCKGDDATVAKLVADGQNLLWYADATGGAPLDPATALIDGHTYYATQTVDGCESHRVGITVTLKNCAVILTNPMLMNRLK